MTRQLQPFAMIMKDSTRFGLLESVEADLNDESIHYCQADVTSSGLYIYPDPGVTYNKVEFFILKNTGDTEISCKATPASGATEQEYHLAQGAILALSDVSATAAIKLDTASTGTQSCQYFFSYKS